MRPFLQKKIKDMEKGYTDIDADIIDTVMGLPQGFKVSDRRFYLYPVTLGKTYLLSRLTKDLEINRKILKANPFMESLRLCREKRKTVCRILTYHTMERKEEIADSDLVKERTAFFSKELDDDAMAELLLMVLNEGNISAFVKHLGIDKEKEYQAKAMRARKDTGSLVFGGKSIYGTLIDAACERYGWTFDYVVWGIGYINLQLLLSDSVTSVYLTDKERKRVHIPRDRNVIKADDPANFVRIKAMKWN